MRQANVDICGSYAEVFGTTRGRVWVPVNHAAICHEMLFRGAFLHPTVMLHTEIAQTHAYNEHVTNEDFELWTRLAPHYRLGNVPEVLLKYRYHPQQSHLIQAPAMQRDRRLFRARHFGMLFPAAQPEDYTALARVADREPCSNLAELETAGRWLVRLAQPEEPMFVLRMAERWRSACRNSAQLGLGCYRLYQQIAPQFAVPDETAARKLWLACMLRLKPGSALLRVFYFARRSTAQKRDRAAAHAIRQASHGAQT